MSEEEPNEKDQEDMLYFLDRLYGVYNEGKHKGRNSTAFTAACGYIFNVGMKAVTGKEVIIPGPQSPGVA